MDMPPLLGKINGRNRNRGNSFATAQGSKPLVSGCFDAYPTDVQIQSLGHMNLHPLDMRGHFGLLGDDRRIDIHETALMENDLARGLLQEDPARCILPSWIGISEEVTDIGLSQGTEDCITNGMHERVSVRMPGQSPGVRDLHSAENQFAPINQRVDVVANADVDHVARLAVRGLAKSEFPGGRHWVSPLVTWRKTFSTPPSSLST